MTQSYENNAKPCYNIISTQRYSVHVDRTQLNNTSVFTDSDTDDLRRATDTSDVRCVTRDHTRDLYTGNIGYLLKGKNANKKGVEWWISQPGFPSLSFTSDCVTE